MRGQAACRHPGFRDVPERWRPGPLFCIGKPPFGRAHMASPDRALTGLPRRVGKGCILGLQSLYLSMACAGALSTGKDKVTLLVKYSLFPLST